MQDLITPREVADLLKVHQATLGRWRAAGIGPAWIEVGGQFRYRRADVDRWLSEQTHNGTENS